MTPPTESPRTASPPDKFEEDACELGADEGEACFNERVKKLVKHKPVEKQK